MKHKERLSALLLLLFLLLSFSACAQNPTEYTVERNGVSYTVDTESATVFDGTNVYRYTLSGDKNNYSLTIVYPDGSYYTCENMGMGSIWGVSEDYDADRYVSGELLHDVITASAPQTLPVGKILLSLILLVLGVFHIACPRIAWFVFNAWRFRNRQNVEPSDIALTLSRAGGVIYIIASVILFYA